MFVVADGMGGVAGGEVASATAIARFDNFRGAAAVDSESVIAAVRGANADVFERRLNDVERRDMGTTLTGVALTRQGGADAVLVFNVGDSRVYMRRGSDVRRVTKDHSVVQELIDAGEITEQEAVMHPERNVVTRIIGGAADVDVDSWLLAPEVGDRFLVCSDGLTGEVQEAELTRMVLSTSPPSDLVDALLGEALAAGARDNVSVLVVDVTDVGHQPVDVDEDTDPRAKVDDAADAETLEK